MGYQLFHPQLGAINGCRINQDFVQFRSLPYAHVPRRFARSSLLDHLPSKPEKETFPYNATEYGPCSIQPLDSIETDVHWNQLPHYSRQEQIQGEDCLRLTVTCPISNRADILSSLPVVVLVHGGALMIGSGSSDDT